MRYNSSKSDGYDRTSKFTGRELVNTTCFASDSVIESAPEVEVNNANIALQKQCRISEGDGQNGATRVAWGAAIKDFPFMCLVVAFLNANNGLYDSPSLHSLQI